MERFVYADNAATTKITQPVLDAMMPYLTEEYGNPSSLYRFANRAKRALEQARAEVAQVLGADPFEILFTAGGSEADNWVKEVMRTQKAKGKNHFITTAVEHHAMLHSAQRLQKEGYEVTFIPVDREGQIDPEDIRRAIRPETGLVSIMFANNEIGTIYPIKEIGAICRQAGVLFHTDAVQAVGHVKINVKEMNIDMLSLSAHKFHGPKGVGAFYCRRGIPLNNLIDGGAQERGKRAGTENVAGIVGLATALRIADSELEQTAPRLTAMRDRLIDGILQSSGSACASSSLDPSHVLLAIGLPHEVAHGSVRLSLSDLNTEEDVDYILEKLPQIVSTLRQMSPLWEQIQKGEVSFEL